jgi:hypothetical protein
MRPTFGQKNTLLKNNRGQATVEYILLIVIILALILGPLQNFSKFIAGFTDSLFGEGKYFACVLESGDLSKGSDCGSALAADIQKASQDNPIDDPNNPYGKPGSNANGGDKSNQNSDDSSSDSSGSSKSSNRNANSKKSRANETSSNARTAGDSAGSSSEASSGLGAAGLNRRGRPREETVKPSKATSSDAIAVAKTGPEYFDFQKSKAKEGIEVSKDRMNRQFNLQEDERRRSEKLSAKTVATNNSTNLKPKAISFEPSRAPAAKLAQDSEEGFTFSAFFKWLLIGCIIIALIVIVGGQLFQVSKGGDN